MLTGILAKARASQHSLAPSYDTSTFVARSVFRELSEPFTFKANPKLVSLRQLKRSIAPHRRRLPSFSQHRTKVSIITITVASPSPPAPGAVPKRKRVTGELKYYAVRKGYNPGIYTTWKECLGQVTGFKGATCKSQPIIVDINASCLRTCFLHKRYGVNTLTFKPPP